MPERAPARALLWLIGGGLAVRVLLASAIGLGVDESYMVAAGRTLHLGYFDHPPVAWWLSAGAARLAGSEAAVVVRLPFIALFAVSTWLMYRLTAALFTPRAGLCAAIAFNLAPVFSLSTAGWVLPDGPLTCALLGMALCLANALFPRPGKVGEGAWPPWLGAGVTAGLALLSKYSAALVIAGAFAGMLTAPGLRPWLRRPQPYVAALLALAVFAPELIWNAQHGWASFAFQGGRAAAARLQPFGPFVTTAGQAAFLLPWIWLGLMAVLLRGLRAGPGAAPTWLLCGMASVPILLFPVVSLWSRNVLFHWAAPGYLMLFPALGAWAAGWRPRTVRRWSGATALLLAVGLLVATSEVRFNWLARIAPGLDPGLQARDWTPLRQELAARGLLGRPIGVPNWSDTGKVAYALGPDIVVLCMNPDAREFAFAPGPEAHIGEDILLVAPRQTPARIAASLAADFESIETLTPARLRLSGRSDVDIPLYLAHRLRHWPRP